MIGLTRTNHEGTDLYIKGVSELNFLKAYKRYQSSSNTKKLRNSLKYEYQV
jgi:hypothetical protein